jgi:hypothetical protein
MNSVVLVVPLVLSIFAALSRRSSHVSKQGLEVFAFPGALVCFLALSSWLIAFAPLWMPIIKPQLGPPANEDYFFFGVFGGLGMLFAAYLYCYRVTVGPEVFSVGAFSRKQFRLADIRACAGTFISACRIVHISMLGLHINKTPQKTDPTLNPPTPSRPCVVALDPRATC